jgi:hypothetical protein
MVKGNGKGEGKGRGKGKALTPLGHLIFKLATDPKALRAYRRDPAAAVKAAGLSKIELAALESKDPGRIRAALGGGAGEQMGMAVFDVTVLVL